MFSADSALAILHTCAPGELEEALRNRPEMIIRLRNVLDAFPPGPGIGAASQSSTAPQPAAATQATASTTTPQPFAQPCMVPGFGGAPIFLMAPGPPPQPAPEAPPAQQATAEARPTIPIRGRDVPHSTPQPEPRPSTPRSPGAWHMDRAGHTWQGEAQHHSRHNWWDRDNWWESWWDQDHRRTASPPAPHSTSRPPRQRAAQHGTSPACRARQCQDAGMGNQPHPRGGRALHGTWPPMVQGQARPDAVRHSMHRNGQRQKMIGAARIAVAGASWTGNRPGTAATDMAVHALHSKRQGSLPADTYIFHGCHGCLCPVSCSGLFTELVRPALSIALVSQQALHITSQHWAQCLAIRTQVTQKLSRWPPA